MSIDTTRQKLTTIVKLFFSTYYPDMEVNYPKLWITDTEKAIGPFARVEFMYNTDAKSLEAGHCVEVNGQLMISEFIRENSGLGEAPFTQFTDNLQTYLGLKTIDQITFREVKSYDNSGIPGFDGTLNSVYFDIEYFNV